MCHTEGMSEQNQCILQVLAQVLSSLTGMWIIGADWNFTPGTLLKTNWLDLVKGVIVAPLAPTCHASVYDFFVVKQELAPSVVAVLRLDDAGLHPHWPSRLILRGDSRRRMIQTLVRPTKIPGVLPFGPPIRPISYTCHGDHKNLTHGLQIALDAKMEHWYHVARRELRGVCTSTANKLVKAKLQYVNAVGKLAEPQPGASWQSHTWQALGRRFTEVLRVGNRGDDYSTALTHTHLKKSWLSIAVAWKDGALSHTLTAWMDAATTATANHDTVALGVLDQDCNFKWQTGGQARLRGQCQRLGVLGHPRAEEAQRWHSPDEESFPMVPLPGRVDQGHHWDCTRRGSNAR
jgi:hypothetical protein